jgi:selenocysteine-specific elongation factor
VIRSVDPEAESRHLVLGTAGHIDHGKSALVLALSGTDPDRLAEEKRRGITIDLGFADLELEAGKVLSFVDVPGHERFVRHMVAGATGIDAVLLVVAADQGVQPQTREHLEICSLLGLQRGVVALTKCDLVDNDLREVVSLEVRELLTGSFLEQAPLVPVSARNAEGLGELRAALCELFGVIPPRPASGVPRLPVDRSFVLHGFGTVVTGTLGSGELHEGLEVAILPSAKRSRIRGLQVHHRKVTRVAAGQRSAVNLQGIECEDVPRGSTVTVPGALFTTRRVWARVQLLPEVPENLRRGGPVRFHQGTCERAARLRVLDRTEDGALQVEIFLDQETVLAPGDRFILRRPAPVDTVGGGTIVDARPPRPKDGAARAFDAQALEAENALRLRLDRSGEAGGEPARIARELALTAEQLEASAGPLEQAGSLVRAAGRWFAGESWREMEERALRELGEFHRAEPLRMGIAREELRARTSREITQEAWRQLLGGLASGGSLLLRGESVALSGHEVDLSRTERELFDRIDAEFRRGGLEPPALEQVIPAGEHTQAIKLVDLLVAQGRLVRIHDGKLFHAAALEDLLVRLREHSRRSRTLSVPEFKQLAGVTRKHAIPLLEHLDAIRVTRRVGNNREIVAFGENGGS